MKQIGPQFQEVKPVVGAFVLITVLAILGLLFVMSRAQRWFQRVATLQLLLPEDGSFGLRRGSSVEMLGSVVGSVDDLWIDDSTDRMQARLSIQSEFFRFVRTDSRFAIKRKTFGLTGDAYVEITRGSQGLAPENATFLGIPDREPTRLLEDLGAEMLPTIRAARGVIEKHGLLAQALVDPKGSMLGSLARIERLLLALEGGEGVVGRALFDPAWARAVDDLLATLQRTTDRLDSSAERLLVQTEQLLADVRSVVARTTTLVDTAQSGAERMPPLLDDGRVLLRRVDQLVEHLQQATATVPELLRVLLGEVRGMDGVVAQSRTTLAEVERLVLGLQTHWLIRGYVPLSEPPRRLSPADLGGGDRR